MNVMIADDEKFGRESVELLVKKFFPYFNILGFSENVEDTVELYKKYKPDVLFLDINMPGGSGLDVLSQIDTERTNVILITAYSQFAIKAIKLSAFDYILKPIDNDEFINSVNKAQRKFKEQNQLSEQISIIKSMFDKNKIEKIALPTRDGLIFIKTNEIIRCEADLNYTTIYTLNKQKLFTTKTLKEFDDLLNGTGFFRVHHSHLINLKYIKKYIKGKGGTVIMDDDSEVEVSIRKKNEFLESISSFT